jgi:4-hydroxy-2-oxoheptanedioate aldolase
MKPNRIRQRWVNGEVASCLWVDVGWPVAVEHLAGIGFDALTLDLQHSLIDRGAAPGLLQAISLGGSTPLVRVSQNDPSEIGFALDAGAYGVFCPQVETHADAQKFVESCRYAPRGTRSWGPTRGLLYGGPDYFDAYQETILTIAIIETVQGVQNMEEIASTPGLDMIYVGPNDLSIDYGGSPTYVPSDPRVIDAMGRSIEIARRNNIRSGTYAGNVEVARLAREKGHALVSVGYAAKIMFAAARATLTAVFPNHDVKK